MTFLLALLPLLSGQTVHAHTFGSVVQHTTIMRSGQGLMLMLDMQLDAGVLIFKPDPDNDGKLSLDEWSALLLRIRELTAKRIRATVGGEPVAVRFEPAGDLTPAPQGIAAGAMVQLQALVPLPQSESPLTVRISDDNFAVPGPEDRLDWFVDARVAPQRLRLVDNYWTVAMTLPPTAGQAKGASAAPPLPTDSTSEGGFESQGAARLLEHIRNPGDSLLVLGLALGLAFFLGAAHSLSPGHGKSLVAAYLVGARGRIADAAKLAAIVTASHVGGVVVLGVLLLACSSFIDLREIHPWIGFGSGLLICAIGYWMLARRALAGKAHEHSHEHLRYANNTAHNTTHNTGHHEHSSLLSLGIIGGMVPCPTAIVVLLAAVAAGQVVLGLALVLAFSLGLALVLLAIGVAMVTASRRFAGLFEKRGLIAKLPVFSAGLVMLAGAAIALNALMQGGILRLHLP